MTLSKNAKIILGFILLIVLGIGYYGISPLFRNNRIDDALPVRLGTIQNNETSIVEEKKMPQISEPIEIKDTLAHPASGQVRIIKDGDKTVVRYENYKTINGPDVRVYLAKDIAAKEFVDLGPIKATEGNINYSVPKGINIDDYRYVLTWCEDFSVLFNSADLSQIQ